MLDRFPHYYQLDAMDCGPSCLRMIAKYHGRNFSLQHLREISHIDREGVSLQGIMSAAEELGFHTIPARLAFDGKEEEQAYLTDIPLPCIIHWREDHFVVVYKIGDKHVWIADPEAGKFKVDHTTFEQRWKGEKEMGICLILDPNPDFGEEDQEPVSGANISFLRSYLRPYRPYFFQLLLGLVLGTLFQLLFPFLTQSLVDIGIQNQNIGFVYLILAAQLMLFLGQTTVTVIQNWLLLHIGTRINVSILADFLIKLMKLPIGFFDVKMVGDLLQRMRDQDRIETFLTNSTLQFIFSAFNLLVFGLVLLLYDWWIFVIFAVSSLLYIAWILIFLRRRKELDYHRFQELSAYQTSLIEIIEGMQEIKLQNSSQKRSRHWFSLQANLFSINLKALAIEQYQFSGTAFISQFKDILITFLTATLVIQGEMTLGMMLAVQFIIGQLNLPLQQMTGFIQAGQDAKLSLERLWEIQQMKSEENEDVSLIDHLEEGNKDFHIEKLSFRYNELAEDVLTGIDLHIPTGKITAIVGTSGSGKTTLVKLLLGFYPVTQGLIKLGKHSLSQIKPDYWRSLCGAVMQDGFIFSDSIANNIAESDEELDQDNLLRAVEVANIRDFIESLPLGYHTMIGAQGNGISQGQRQRILIARAVYKDPEFLFFDEATNALDANNEKMIIDNLNQFFQGKTVVVVAHRLSTVKHADQIVVLEKGALIEQGNHEELISLKGSYYQLIKNQLELGN